MRAYILFPLFLLGLVCYIVQRVRFEKYEKDKNSARYNSLYRRHSLVMIVIFLALTLDLGTAVLKQLGWL